MRKFGVISLCLVTAFSAVFAQAPVAPTPNPQARPDDIIRITTELVQTEVVVVDKADRPVSDLKLEDFELFENGKKQQLQFLEFVSLDVNTLRPSSLPAADRQATIAPAIATDVSNKDLKRVMAFVVDDVTVPVEDLKRVRDILSYFVERQMLPGDLVAIIRTTVDNPLLQQLTADKQILRRAIAEIGIRSVSPTLSGSDDGRVRKIPGMDGSPDTSEQIGSQNTDAVSKQVPKDNEEGNVEVAATTIPEDVMLDRVPKAYQALKVSNSLVKGLSKIRGRKNIVLIAGALPVFQTTDMGQVGADVNYLIRLLTDNATRSGVVINTLDVRGLSDAMARFTETPAKSALGGGTLAGSDGSESFGRSSDSLVLKDRPSGEQVTLRTLAATTGGISIVDKNNFRTGLDKILMRSRAYYRLAYKSTEKFDYKFHKLEVKVKRSGVRVYGAEGYFAREDRSGAGATKEKQIVAAAASPLAKRDLDVTAELQYQFNPDNKAQLDINAFINANKLSFKKTPDGKYQTAFDVVGFVFDELGDSRGGISQTVNVDLTEENYRRALATGLSYSANTLLPPGYYQVRLVIRETETGKIGTVSRYFEVPDLTNKRLNMSSILLYGVKPGADVKVTPEQLPATRVISRQQDLRYAAIVYNAKAEGGKASQLIISQGDKVLFKEPEQALVTAGRAPGQYVKVGQIGLAKVPPGKYLLTLTVSDPLGDKGPQTFTRTVEFTVVD